MIMDQFLVIITFRFLTWFDICVCALLLHYYPVKENILL